jgi:hypothetical protein
MTEPDADHVADGRAVIERCRATHDLELDDHDPRETFGWDKHEAKYSF